MRHSVLAALAVITLAFVVPAKAQVFGPSGSGCPTATASVLGCVKPDGTTVTITNGVISAPSGGSGNVTGPASSIANHFATFSGTTGKIIQDGGLPLIGMTTGQVPVAAGANTVTSSQPFGLTGASTLVETTAGGLLTPSILPLATSGALGAIQGDGSTLPISAGVISCATSTTSQLGCVKPDGTSITIVGGTISATGSSGANPTGTAGPTANNGVATTFMRSDATPAVQKGSASQFGIVEADGSTITASAGVLSGAAAGNPTATIGTSATNGVATSFMRSDAAPAIPQCSASTFGACKVDGSTITAAAGVISGPSAANPTGTIGTTANNGSATTFMRSDGTPAIPACSSSTFGACKSDGQTIAAASGVLSRVSPDRSNAGASVVVVAGDMGGQINLTGSAQTLTIPAISSTVFASGMVLIVSNNGSASAAVSSTPTINGCSGTIPVGGFQSYISNGTSIDCFAGSSFSVNAANPSATIGTSAVNGSATTYMRSDAAPAIPQCSASTFGACKVDGTTITASNGVITSVGGGGSTGANPTATIGTSAVNGVATTFMRSDAAPAIPQATSSTFGAVKVDNSTITAAAGVISAVVPTAANPTGTISTSAVNGSATTFMRSDAAPAIPQCSATTFGACKVDGSTITATGGVLSGVTPPPSPYIASVVSVMGVTFLGGLGS